MNIVQISESDGVGGAAQTAWVLYKSFELAGHNSYLSVRRRTHVESHIFEIPDLKYRGQWQAFLEVKRQLLKKYPRKSLGLRRAISFFDKAFLCLGNPSQWIRGREGYENFDFPGSWHALEGIEIRPDIVHCHNLHGEYFDLRALPGLSRQYPLVLNLHDAWLLSGHCAHSFRCERWQTGCGLCPDLSIPPAIRRDRTADNWRKKREIFEQSLLYVTAPSQWLMDKVNLSMLRPRLKKVIPNGIDLEVFHPHSRQEARELLGLPLDHKIILFAGHLTVSNPWKDFLMAKEALSLVKDRMPGVKLLFLFLGEAAQEEHLSEDCFIKYASYKDKAQDVAKYYQAADLYIHAAKADTYPRVISEAMACGLPVVATLVGGIPEQIKEGETGFLVPSGDAVQMSERVVRLLEDEMLRKNMSLTAVQDAKERLGIGTQTKALLTWYKEVIQDWQVQKH